MPDQPFGGGFGGAFGPLEDLVGKLVAGWSRGWATTSATTGDRRDQDAAAYPATGAHAPARPLRPRPDRCGP